MDMCNLKNAELEAKHQKYKGRIVLRGNIVKDDSGSYAVFAEQGSSASQMTAAKVMDIISRLPGCAGQAADAVSACTQVKNQLGKKVLLGLFLGYALYAGGIWKGDILVADIEELETMDASEIYSKRLTAKEVTFPKENGKFIFPAADGRIKLSGGDQELRTPTLLREHQIRGESHRDFLGESERSLPPPQDSFPDAGDAINDFWSMSGNFKYRHHVEPRVKLYSPREESFPVPLKYIDVSRTTRTNLDVMQERRIDDYCNIDGSRDLSDSWTGFTQFTLLE